MKPLIAAFLLACSMASGAADLQPKFAQSGLDITDLWFNRSESGWGLNVIQQSNTSFASLFIYGAGGAPTWYVASDLAFQGVDTATGDSIHSGALYQTTGPAFSGSFDPASVTVRQVGTMTLRARVSRASSELYAGTLTYSIDGITVTKEIERQTWRIANHSGMYQAILRETWTGCNAAAANGEFGNPGTLTVTQSSSTPPVIMLKFESDDGLFTYTITGAYYQAGRNGSIPSLTLARTYPNSGNDTATGYALNVNSGSSGMSGEFYFSNITAFPGCTTVSRIAAAR